MFGKLKQNLRIGERIRIGQTTDPNLDGSHGTILGIAASHAEVDFYIVGLDEPYPGNGHLAIPLIESCIGRISNQ